LALPGDFPGFYMWYALPPLFFLAIMRKPQLSTSKPSKVLSNLVGRHGHAERVREKCSAARSLAQQNCGFAPLQVLRFLLGFYPCPNAFSLPRTILPLETPYGPSSERLTGQSLALKSYSKRRTPSVKSTDLHTAAVAVLPNCIRKYCPLTA
jgi:hypothetical protein